jgi:hypothetical protein
MKKNFYILTIVIVYLILVIDLFYSLLGFFIMSYQSLKSFIINSSLFTFSHLEMTNKVIEGLLATNQLVLIHVEEQDGSKQAYQVNSIESNLMTNEPIYRVTPATLDPFDFTTIVYRNAKYIKKTDTGRDDDLVTV